MNALLISTDLMALSAADGAAQRTGVALRTVAPNGAIEAAGQDAPRVVAIDLTAPIEDLATLVEQLREAAPGVVLVAYGPHVHEARLQAAQEAGCEHVLSRGQFHKGFGELLADYAASAD